eukprot:GILI01030754.1.p1 GENE.GILI01030754.1~~GILI01030754.1.p1  ORF type:complete len:127 (+),score=19.80 GILI01030754.1:62-442(+)
MALVLTDEIDIEAQRILDAPDNFVALKLQPSNCSVTDVLASYESISSILRRKEAIRNPKAAKARAKLDQAKLRLSNEKQLNIEKGKFQASYTSATVIPPEMVAKLNYILNTTESLERRASTVTNAL